MLTARNRRPAFVVAILAALIVGWFSIASARTYHHGTSVWFSDETIHDGDDVAGDLDIYFGNVTCEAGGHIEGNVRKFFGSFDADDNCIVDGRVTDAFDESAVVPPVPWLDRMDDDFSAQNRGLFKKLGWDAVVVFAFLLFPLRVRIGLDRVERHPGLSAAAGVVAVIAALPVAVMLLITVIGIPLIVLEFAALLACLWIGWAAVAVILGRRLLELARPHATPSPLAALVAGLVLVTAAQMLPIVGWAVTALMTFVALGSALLAFVRESSFGSFTGTVPGGPASPGAPAPPGAGPPMNRPA